MLCVFNAVCRQHVTAEFSMKWQDVSTVSTKL